MNIKSIEFQSFVVGCLLVVGFEVFELMSGARVLAITSFALMLPMWLPIYPRSRRVTVRTWAWAVLACFLASASSPDTAGFQGAVWIVAPILCKVAGILIAYCNLKGVEVRNDPEST